MVEAAICDGDWPSVRRQPDASNGEIVCGCAVDDECHRKARSSAAMDMSGYCRTTPLSSRSTATTGRFFDSS